MLELKNNCLFRIILCKDIFFFDIGKGSFDGGKLETQPCLPTQTCSVDATSIVTSGMLMCCTCVVCGQHKCVVLCAFEFCICSDAV